MSGADDGYTPEYLNRLALVADINGGGVWGHDAESVASCLLARGWGRLPQPVPVPNPPCTEPIEEPTAPGVCATCGASVEWREMRSGWGRKLHHSPKVLEEVFERFTPIVQEGLSEHRWALFRKLAAEHGVKI